nr:MAG TPA: hypothetical protein [Caudoviricetes sp.]
MKGSDFMYLIFNDSTSISIQFMNEVSGYLKIRIVNLNRDEILKMFKDVEKTKKMVFQEREQNRVLERYTKFESLTEFAGGIFEICMIQEGKAVSEIIDDLSEQITDLQVALCEVFEGLEV